MFTGMLITIFAISAIALGLLLALPARREGTLPPPWGVAAVSTVLLAALAAAVAVTA